MREASYFLFFNLFYQCRWVPSQQKVPNAQQLESDSWRATETSPVFGKPAARRNQVRRRCKASQTALWLACVNIGGDKWAAPNNAGSGRGGGLAKVFNSICNILVSKLEATVCFISGRNGSFWGGAYVQVISTSGYLSFLSLSRETVINNKYKEIETVNRYSKKWSHSSPIKIALVSLVEKVSLGVGLK